MKDCNERFVKKGGPDQWTKDRFAPFVGDHLIKCAVYQTGVCKFCLHVLFLILRCGARVLAQRHAEIGTPLYSDDWMRLDLPESRARTRRQRDGRTHSRAASPQRITSAHAKNGIAAHVQTAAMPSANYACLLEAVVDPRVSTEASRTPVVRATFRATCVGLVSDEFDLSWSR